MKSEELKRADIRILLIEDNPGDARLLQEMLKEAADIRFEVETADRLALAINYLKHNPIDAVILDLGLPDCQGLATLIKLNGIKPEAPVIVLTGLADETMGTQAVKEGAQDYLVKGSFDSKSLVKAIRYAIERQKLLKEIKVLRGILPICSYCKKIRDDKGYWEQMEMYIRDHSEAEFSHGMCPACAEKAYAELEDFKQRQCKDK